MSQKKRAANSPEEVVDLDERANDVVRYIIYRAGEHLIISKAELSRNVINKAGGKYEEIITRAQKILRQVYGYNLIVCDSVKGKDKHYVLSSLLPYVSDPSQETCDDAHKVLLLLILSHIFMSNNQVTDTSMYTFLQGCGIDVEQKHPVFGHVKEYINKVLIKQQYLTSEIDTISRKHNFKWGLRAEKEISKMAVLKFVCKIYKNKQPSDWVNQFELTKQQAFENYYEQVVVPMEHDE